MLCDVRNMHPADVPVMWAKVRKNLYRAEVSHDDGEWFLRVEGSDWKFDSHARNFEFKDGKLVSYEHAAVFTSYYPPRGGNVRFDSHVYPDAAKGHPSFAYGESRLEHRPGEVAYWSFCDDLVREYGEALVARGGAGKNRLSYFEPSFSPGVPAPTPVSRGLARLVWGAVALVVAAAIAGRYFA